MSAERREQRAQRERERREHSLIAELYLALAAVASLLVTTRSTMSCTFVQLSMLCKSAIYKATETHKLFHIVPAKQHALENSQTLI